MKFTIDRKAFLERLNIVSRAISAHSPKPILSGVYLSLEENRLVLIGSESQLSIQSILYPQDSNHLHIEEPGNLVVESRYLLDVVRKMGGERATFELLDNSILQIQDTSATFKLRILPAADYPLPDFSKPSNAFYLKADLIRDIVNQVGFAASEKDVRPVLMGVHFVAKDNELVCAATDSYRLAKKTIPISDLPDFDITIPVKALNEVIRAVREDENIYVYNSSKKIQFHFEDNLVQSSLIEGAYPAIDRIIPKEFAATLMTDAYPLEMILDRSMIYQSERVTVVRMECDSKEILVYSSSKDVGSSDQYLYDADYQGNPIRISFNGQFMLQALKGLNCQDRVRLQFISELKPIRITNPEDESLEMIVVPLRTH